MVEFAAVLAEVEAREREGFRAARIVRVAPAPVDKPVRKGCAREAADAYAEVAPQQRKPAPLPDRAAVFSEIATARGNAVRLRALRRRLALRLHPDRIEGETEAGLLAEFNAAIDAALRG